MRLHGYFRSTAAYRVRIALALKGIACERTYVNLLKGEQTAPAYRALNPQGRVPLLETDGFAIAQSPAILEYLEETHPEPPLLPGDAKSRAAIRAVSAVIGCDVHPLNNLAVLKYLTGSLGVSEEAKSAWYAHWVLEGFNAVEAMIAPAPFAFGAEPTMADIYIAPQVYNAKRFDIPLDAYPRIRAVAAACAAHPAFVTAAPETQPDAA
ncbi:MAG: maleylacetoacetate isomerase [Salinarimonadaceae bacterium]|nr:MAG: maleylacetoacetate isomerase [Salinarimonadaceae bacterium]